MVFVTEIQGNRVVIKGCTFGCKDCPTPELQSFQRELIFEQELCIGCRRCVGTCQRKALQFDGNGITLDRKKCVICGRCVQVCKGQALRTVGRNYSAGDLARRLADETFDGKIIISGGEILALDQQYLQTLVKGLFDRGISVSIETCGYRDNGGLEAISPYIDEFTFRRQ